MMSIFQQKGITYFFKERKKSLFLQPDDVSYVAELLQHLLAMSQVRSHELGSIHLDLLPDFPGGQARLEGDIKLQLIIHLTTRV